MRVRKAERHEILFPKNKEITKILCSCAEWSNREATKAAFHRLGSVCESIEFLLLYFGAKRKALI